jgi:hypothetical protein
VRHILDVLAVLEEPVTGETRAELARLLQTPKATRSDAPRILPHANKLSK